MNQGKEHRNVDDSYSSYEYQDNSSVYSETGSRSSSGRSRRSGGSAHHRHHAGDGGGPSSHRGGGGEDGGNEQMIRMGEFFQLTMNNGVQDGVICFKLLVIGMLVIAALVIGNAAFVFTTGEILEDYQSEVRCHSFSCPKILPLLFRGCLFWTRSSQSSHVALLFFVASALSLSLSLSIVEYIHE